GILPYRDRQSCLFYQLVDRDDLNGNYLETSGSAMVAYAIIKGCRLEMLEQGKYFQTGEESWAGLEAEKLKMDSGNLHLMGTCASAGLGPKDERDGSPEYYLSERVAVDNAHGVAACMMAYGEWLKFKK
ncbi:MAG: glycoside hydrolase family 88 protein, partial [Hungatella sp.]